MKTASSVEEDGRDVNISVGCEAEESTAVTPKDGRMVDSRRFVYTRARKCGQLISSRKTVSARYRLMVRCVDDEKTG